MKQNLNKSININNKQVKEKKHKRSVNNINNNIIINKNLNENYNNNYDCNLKNIFKKKTLGNSFSIKDKKNNMNNSNYSIEKKNNQIFYLTNTDEQNMFKIKRKIKIKNEWRKKLCNNIKEKNNENTFIKVNKINPQLKPNKIKIILNNISFGNTRLNTDNNKKLKNNNININNSINIYTNKNDEEIGLKSKIIQRINRVLKMQKESEEKLKSFEKIKVNQRKNNMKEIRRNLNNNKLNYMGATTTTTTTIVNKKENEKEKEKEKCFTEKRIRANKSYNNMLENKKRKLILMKELINLPLGKRQNILEIIKTNNILTKSVSPSAKRILHL